uniref:Uncharacterized protein n=1 Tax=Prorocentrum micans TaxID=2945 RepID=A0A7S2X4U5_PROMC|mmetsp:Transcript_3153/g.2469  ORF Transcript_3153/g.2469 Transcript_3153/m.2469 type:complete len:103 (+) Transcript_3153:370-678(+)
MATDPSLRNGMTVFFFFFEPTPHEQYVPIGATQREFRGVHQAQGASMSHDAIQLCLRSRALSRGSSPACHDLAMHPLAGEKLGLVELVPGQGVGGMSKAAAV